MNRRQVVGWLLFLAWPGVMAGTALSAFLALRAVSPMPLWTIPDLVALFCWGVATVGSAVGGQFVSSAEGEKAGSCNVSFAAGVFGATVYGVALGLADYLPWF